MEVISPLTSMDLHSSSPATVPFAWEDKPGVPNPLYKFLEQDFEFDVSGEFTNDSVPAEELFDGGVIKRLETKTNVFKTGPDESFSRSRRTQSFSTHRGWQVPWEQQSPTTNNTKPRLVSSSSTLSASSSTKGLKRWSFKNLFLFRSASDGRAMDRDPLKKYSAVFFRIQDEEYMKSSVRSIEPQTHGSGSGSGSKRRGVSAHELHYKVNRAVANDMKKKTFLPYKQGILGSSAFNPSVHALSNGFGVSNHSKE
ncbi:uncharacterized protein LOC143557313 [Bidens hawaiensis]|uniref:uncharacterized protein LOC143557313 n=1 Tax=Bidens hawaiensis TaxID=980011 RepID=UPI004049C0A6